MREDAAVRSTSRLSGQLAVLRAVHARPGITRAAVAGQLGMPSGFAAETTARLTSLGLLTERPAPPTGTRGRPTTALHPHPDGPLVAVAAIAHETWQVAAVQLGGATLDSASQTHQRGQADVLTAVSAALDTLRGRYGDRIRAVAVAVPGTVAGSRLIHAPNLGWHQVDLSALWAPAVPESPARPATPESPASPASPAIPLLAGNDATFAAIAEARRGAAAGAGTALHLYLDAGVGGAVIEGDRALLGASGMAGEFGHMPFGDPALRCRCGAMGCWNTSLDGHAVARALGQPAPDDEVSYTRHVLAAAEAGQAAELSAMQALARSLGRGTAGLVNAFDPDVVTVGGLARGLLALAGEHVIPAYRDGLMRFRATPPPGLIPARLGGDAPLTGAAEDAFAAVLTEDGLRAWTLRSTETLRTPRPGPQPQPQPQPQPGRPGRPDPEPEPEPQPGSAWRPAPGRPPWPR
jgi:predicted NBD/HSP70 family sugar kinase